MLVLPTVVWLSSSSSISVYTVRFLYYSASFFHCRSNQTFVFVHLFCTVSLVHSLYTVGVQCCLHLYSGIICRLHLFIGYAFSAVTRLQICTSLQTNNHASTPPLSFLHAQPTVSKHWRHLYHTINNTAHILPQFWDLQLMQCSFWPW